MKKKIVCALLALAAAAMLAACGGDKPAADTSEPIVLDDVFNDNGEVISEAAGDKDAYADNIIPAGMYRSELTGEVISEELKNQRPVCIMVDNESIALDHFGVNSADIVYEMMNSTMNGRITRLMCVVKDWKQIEKFGSVRSTRPTNVILSYEYNAILIHDGGPFYIDTWLNRAYANHLSGGFARYSNGKSAEFTEYVTYDGYKNPTTGKSYSGLGDRIKSAGYSEEYNSEYYHGEDRFIFDPKGVDLSSEANSKTAKNIELPFPHNSSKLKYNEDTKLYEYYEYGKPHIDPLDDNKTTAFKNVVLQKAFFVQHDEHGYLTYDVINKGEGMFITEGNAIPVKWEKIGELGRTTFTNANTGEEISVNVGKTYIGIVPYDTWEEIVIE